MNAKECVASKKALDYQEGGKHYLGLAIQPVVYCYKNKLNPVDANIVKYFIGYGDVKDKHLSKPLKGYFKKHEKSY